MNLPFERNHYFRGKLLSAEDFLAEQQYFNQKRQLLNRILYGGGVLCGLDVLKLDEKSILVQTGAALDYAGREIVLAKPITRNLSLIKGFSYENRAGFSYLCILFEEKPQGEAVALEGEKQYNRISEEARLVLVSKEPAAVLETQSLDEILEDNRLVYLAKIHYVTGENTFALGEIEDMRHSLIPEKAAPQEPGTKTAPLSDALAAKIEGVLRQYVQLTLTRPAAASGMETIDFGLGAKRHRVFYSKQIAHGLGAGYAAVTLGLVQETADSQTLGERSVCYGDCEIFDADYSLAAKLNAMTGTFVIGVRLHHDTPVTQVRVFWTAFRGSGESLTEGMADAPLTILPNVVRLSCRESHAFSLEGIDKGENVLWSLVEPDGGSIDPKGQYHAPNTPGIFEIRASANGREASAFAIVQ